MSVEEEENPRLRRNPGMMGGGAASEEGEFALDSVTNEAAVISTRASNAGLGYDEGSQVNVESKTQSTISTQEGSGEDYEEQQESWKEAEAVDDDTDEGKTTTTTVQKIDTEDTIDGETVVGTTQTEEISYITTPTTREPIEAGIISTNIQYEPSDYADPTLGNIPKLVGTPLDPMDVQSGNWLMEQKLENSFRGTHPVYVPENPVE